MTEWSKLTGHRFVHLKAIYPIGEDSYRCSCTCGKLVTVLIVDLQMDNVQSCGCLPPVDKRTRWMTDRFHKHGLNSTSEHRAWVNMKQRCYNKRARGYANYGGRGVTVCERWLNSFQNFIDDMGMKEKPNLSLDLIDVDGNYEPGNCRWATRTSAGKQ